MEFFDKYGLIILLILTVIIAGVAVYNLIKTKHISKSFLGNTLTFTVIEENSADIESSDITMIVRNTNLNDVGINALGFVYSNKYYSLMEHYESGLKEGGLVLVAQRSSIKLTVKRTQLENILISGSDKKRAGKVYAYTIDKSGFVSRGEAKIVKALLKKKFKELKIEKRLAAAQIKQSARLEKRNAFEEYITSKRTQGSKLTLKEHLTTLKYKIFKK